MRRASRPVGARDGTSCCIAGTAMTDPPLAEGALAFASRRNARRLPAHHIIGGGAENRLNMRPRSRLLMARIAPADGGRGPGNRWPLWAEESQWLTTGTGRLSLRNSGTAAR